MINDSNTTGAGGSAFDAALKPTQYNNTGTNEGGFLPPEEELKVKDVRTEIGQSGTLVFTGFISGEEYNSDLAGRKGLDVYDQMRKGDSYVQASLQVIKLPIMAAGWNIEPASDTPEDVAAAELVENCLFDGDIMWHDFLRECMTFLDFGYSVFEKVYEPKDIDGKTYMCLTKLGPRKQKTILRWETDHKTAGITQQTYSGGLFSIPRQKLAVFTWQQEGDNYEGVSILRPAYKNWYIKDQLIKIDAIAHERQGVGIPVIVPPDNADEADLDKAREALRNLRANEQGYIEVPKGYTIEILDMKAHGTMDPTKSIQMHSREILLNVLGQFLDLGAHGRGGSHALSADMSRLFEQSLEAVAKKIADVINRDVIKQLVDLNFTVSEYPKLVPGQVADDNIQIISEATMKLANAGLLTPDPDMEQQLRDIMHLSPLPDEYRKNYNNRPRAQAATVADPRDPATLDNENVEEQALPELPDESDEIAASESLSDLRMLHGYIGKKIDGIQKRSLT